MATSKRSRRGTARAATPKSAAEQAAAAARNSQEIDASSMAAGDSPIPPALETQAASTGPTVVMPVEQATPRGDAAPPPSAPTPTAAERTAQSLAQERAAMMSRRVGLLGGALLLLVAGLFAYQYLGSASPAPSALAPIAAPTSSPAPTIQATPAAAPLATAVPPTSPTAAPVATATLQPAAPTASGATACAAITGLPVYDGATCIEQKSDQEDGVTKLKNTYAVNSHATEVQRFYESAFASNGWTLQEFTYGAEQGQRQLKIEVQGQQGPNGVFTEIRLTERGAPAAGGATCSAIAGLPVYPNATCTKSDTDQDDGLFKVENTYTVAASPEDIRRFYGGTFAQGGWSGLELAYEILQGARRVALDVDTQPGPSGAFTRFKIEEK